MKTGLKDYFSKKKKKTADRLIGLILIENFRGSKGLKVEINQSSKMIDFQFLFSAISLLMTSECNNCPNFYFIVNNLEE